MGTKQKRTVLRTIRLPEELEKILEQDAEVQKTTVNGLLYSILVKYSEWDRFTVRFDHISVPRTLFRALLDLIDENSLAMLADRVGVELPNEIVSFWFKKVSMESMRKLLCNSCQYAKIGEVEIEDNGRDHTFSIYHEYGRNWSTFWKHFLDKAIRTYLKATPQIETSENEVTVRFQNP